jgi:hypothetical protein
LVKWYEKTYGKGFIEVRHPLHGTAFVKVDGNRRISIFKESDLYVWAVFTDLLAKKDSLDFIPNTINDSKDPGKDSGKKQDE